MIEGWNDAMKDTRLETLFISIYENFKNVDVIRFRFLVSFTLFSIDNGLSELTRQFEVPPLDSSCQPSKLEINCDSKKCCSQESQSCWTICPASRQQLHSDFVSTYKAMGCFLSLLRFNALP